MAQDAAKPQGKVDPDRDLVRRSRSGDYGAFEALVSKYERNIYTSAIRIVQRHEDAEEVVQETFLSVLEHLEDFQEASTFHTWLTRIATNHALKVLRRRRSRPAISLDVHGRDEEGGEAPLPHPDFIAQWRDDPVELAHRRETQQLLTDALAELDEKYRLVFVLRDVEGFSTEEAARLLEISVANAKVRLLRARLMLREKLTRALGDPARRLVPDHSHDEE